MSTIIADLDTINQINELEQYCLNHQPRAILSDMDGTLLSSEPLHVEATQIWLERRNISPQNGELDELVLGRDDQSIFQELCLRYPQIRGQEFVDEKHSIFAQLVKQKPEMVMIPPVMMDFLQKQKTQGTKIALITASVEADMDLILDANNLGSFFDLKISANQVSQIKPHPEAYLTAMEKFNLNYTQCLILEDSPTGLRAATQTRAPIFKISWFNS